MSAECVEFVKRGRKEYKALEAIVKEWKMKAVEVVSEVLPKMHMMHTSKAKATDLSGTDASIKVHLHDFLLALLLRSGACLLLCPLCLLCTVYTTLLGTWCAEVCLVGGALHAMCQSALVISVSAFTIFHIFGAR
jgi:hypothetical protein